MRKILLTAALVCAAAFPALAQTEAPTEQIAFDLSGDGLPDRITLFPGTDDDQIVTIARGIPGGFAPAERASLPATQSPDGPTLEQLPSGALAIHIVCFACGRTHTRQDVTVIFRNGRFIVAGFTYTAADRIYAQVTLCDVNLLTGHADVGLMDYDVHRVAAPADRAFPFAALTADYWPKVCATIPDYSDELLERLSK